MREETMIVAFCFEISINEKWYFNVQFDRRPEVELHKVEIMMIETADRGLQYPTEDDKWMERCFMSVCREHDDTLRQVEMACMNHLHGAWFDRFVTQWNEC